LEKGFGPIRQRLSLKCDGGELAKGSASRATPRQIPARRPRLEWPETGGLRLRLFTICCFQLYLCSDVRYWHKADITALLIYVRFRG